MDTELTEKKFLVSLRRAGMDYLARREHTRHELIQKISRKFPETAVELISAIVDRLADDNLQSDERFTESYVRYRKSRGFGFTHIKQNLLQRKVPCQFIDHYLSLSDPDWSALLEIQIAKKIGHLPILVRDSKEHHKLLRFLNSRGFPPELVRQTVERRLISSGNCLFSSYSCPPGT